MSDELIHQLANWAIGTVAASGGLGGVLAWAWKYLMADIVADIKQMKSEISEIKRNLESGNERFDGIEDELHETQFNIKTQVSGLVEDNYKHRLSAKDEFVRNSDLEAKVKMHIAEQCKFCAIKRGGK